MIMMAGKHLNSETYAMLMAAVSTLSPLRFSTLIDSLSAVFQQHCSRLATLLSSPILFSISLNSLPSLSLRAKSTLIARYLLSNLLVLMNHLPGNITTNAIQQYMKQQDLDTTLLILLISEVHQHDTEFLRLPSSQWRARLLDYVSGTVLSMSRSMSRLGGVSETGILIEYIANVEMCLNFVRKMGFGRGGELVRAAAEVVVRLPSAEVSGGGVECVICTEDMEGRTVCEMPCGHLFHWGCILRWFRKTNTCPCCRYSLPTNNVYREIERIMEEVAKVGGGGLYRDRECP